MNADRTSLDDQKLSAVLPFALTGVRQDPLEVLRARMLLESFLLTFSLADLHTFRIVCPPHEMPAIRAFVCSVTADQRFEVVSEIDVCPELGAVAGPNVLRAHNGWFRQQIIKLASADSIETGVYLTFDADIICVRRFSLRDLIVDGKPTCGVERRRDYDELYIPAFADNEVTTKQTRVDWAQRVWGLPRPADYAGRFYSETPTLYHTASVRRMAGDLERRYRKSWRRTLIDELPWTEQALFFHWLEVNGLLEDTYRLSHRNALLRLDQSLWQPADCYRDLENRTLEGWQPRNMFDDDADGYFVAFQSSLGGTSENLENAWRQIERRLDNRPAGLGHSQAARDAGSRT
jgi:hypothetical protein